MRIEDLEKNLTFNRIKLDEHSSLVLLNSTFIYEGKTGCCIIPSKPKSKSPRSKSQGAHLFKNSEYYDYKKFEEALKKEGWDYSDIKFYYNSAKNYSESKGITYVNWIAAVKTWRAKKNETTTNTIAPATKSLSDYL